MPDARAGIASLTAFDAVFSAERLAQPSVPAGRRDAALAPDAGGAATVLAVAEQDCVYLAGGTGMLNRQVLDSLLFRAWLFGILTFLEARARDRIRRDPEWREALSAGRLEKARELKEERARRGRAIGTVEALQFGDLGWIATTYDGWYPLFGVASKRQAKQLVKRLEALRNALAHGQAVVAHDWDTIVVVAQAVVRITEAERVAGVAGKIDPADAGTGGVE